MPPATVQTAQDLRRFSEPGKTAELVRGVLVVREPPFTSHGSRAARLTVRMGAFVEREGLGEVFAQDTGFQIERDPDTVRAPDLAFVASARLGQIPQEGYAEVAPDLVVEVLSPSDRPGAVLEKVGQWLSAGTRLVWVVDPAHRHTRVYRADGSVSIVGPEGELDGEDVLPGFRCPLGEIL
ncbi:MAG TPA: Uma2 family endonuclease [Gemmatimonadales bacterium]|nr:Uma2 family endonuclease [Gemmatimonadales bacterium]